MGLLDSVNKVDEEFNLYTKYELRNHLMGLKIQIGLQKGALEKLEKKIRFIEEKYSLKPEEG